MFLKRTLALSVLLFLLPMSMSAALAAEAVTPPVELADATAIAVDWSKGDIQSVTLGGNRTLTFSNGQKGGRYMLIVRQDATGSRTVTWPPSVRWPGGPPQTGGQPASILTTNANRTDYLTFFYNGVNYDVLGLVQNY